MTIVYILAGLAIAAVVGVFIGQATGRHAVEGALWGGVLGPIGWLIMALTDQSRRCPFCRGKIHRRPMLCPHCRSELYVGRR